MTGRLNFKRERGQMLAIVAVSIVAMCACGAFVMDVGAWYRAQRATQTAADAAALAGAQQLPLNAFGAQALATEYADKNGGGLTETTFASQTFLNDTISTKVERTSPAFLARVLGLTSVDMSATASARAWNIGAARYAAPFGVIRTEPMLNLCSGVCFGSLYPTELDLNRVGPGSFKILNIDGSQGGTGPGTLSEWISGGLSGLMDIGWYWSDTGAKFSSGQVKDAMEARVGSDILLPIYDQTQGNGSNFEYRVIGWAGFRLTDFRAQGNNATLNGYFVSVAWEGTPTDSPANFFGAKVIKLVS